MATRTFGINKFFRASLGLLVSLVILPAAHADTLEDRMSTPTDGHAMHPFQHNPAMIDLDKFGLFLAYDSSTKKTTVTGSKGTNNEAEITYDRPVKTQGAALQVPLGGAALVMSGQYVGDDLSGKSSASNRGSITEYYRERRYEGRFVLELVSKLKFGFAYKYHQIQSDVYGSFNLATLDRTAYKGMMTGYSVGLFYEDEKFGLGAFSVAPMRGKSEILSEQKLITYPGLAGFDGYYALRKEIVLGVFYKKWFYKKTDLTEISTSPEDDRTIALGGIDLDQFFYRTNAVGVGADLELISGIVIRLGAIRQDGVFMFTDSAVPGDNKDVEKAVEYNIYKAGIRLQKDKISAEFMMQQSSRAADSITDQRGVFGHRNYSDYLAKEQGAYVALSFQL